MEVNQEMVFRCGLCHILEEFDCFLVVPVHEIYLEAFDAHFGEVLADTLDVSFNGFVSRPENQADVLAVRIAHELFQIDFRDYLEQVGLLVHCPALVKYDVFDAVGCGEVNVIFIRLVVDPCPEVHSVQVPIIPPVPCDFPWAHPAEI